MGAGNTTGNLLEEGLLDFDELRRFRHVEDLFDLAEEHDLLLRACLRPVLEQAADDLLRQGWILLQELDDAVGQLGVVERQALDLVQWQQDLDQKLLVLHLQRQGESVDNAGQLGKGPVSPLHQSQTLRHDLLPPKNLQQLAHTIKVFRLVNESVDGWKIDKRFIGNVK